MIATDLGRHMTADDFTFMIERAKRNAEAAKSQGARPLSGAGEVGAMPAFKTIEQGAATSVYACVAPELAERGGTYLSDCAIAQPSAWANSDENAERLWTLSQALTGVVFK